MFDRSQQWRRRAGLAGVVAMAAAAVAACGSGTQGDTGGSDSAGGGNVTLTLKHITDNEPAFTKLIAEYKKVAPNVTIQPSYAPVDDLQTSLRAQLGGGNAPDLFVVWPGNGSAMSVQQLAPAGVLADISDQKLDQERPREPARAARQRRQDLHVLLGRDADRRHLQQEGARRRGRDRAAEDVG